MAVDAARVLLPVSAMLFPASLIPEGEIMIGVGQHMPFSFLPEFEGDTVRLEDFFCRLVAEVSPPLICRSGAPEQSAMLHPANPRYWLLAMSVKLQKPTFDTLLQVANGAIAVESPALQDNELMSRFKSVAIVEFFDPHWFPLKGNREVIRDFPPTGNRK